LRWGNSGEEGIGWVSGCGVGGFGGEGKKGREWEKGKCVGCLFLGFCRRVPGRRGLRGGERNHVVKGRKEDLSCQVNL